MTSIRRIAYVALAVLGLACGDDDKTLTDAPGPIDAADPCAACGTTQLCVQRFDGVCNGAISCVPRTASCPANACSMECEQAYCPSPYQCMNRAPCGTEVAGAFTCYGP